MVIKELTEQTSRVIMVLNKEVEVRVTIEVSYDDYFNANDFEPVDRELLQSKIDSYTITPVVIRVLGHVEGHLFGIELLGGVLMENKSDIDGVIKEYDMIDRCLEDTKTELIKFLKKVL